MSTYNKNPISEKIFNLVKEIPYGRVTTYGILAKKVGINPRQVGTLLHQNPEPIQIPCHRVVNREGRLASNFAFGGLTGQQDKLTNENIPVKGTKVELDKYLWNFSGESI